MTISIEFKGLASVHSMLDNLQHSEIQDQRRLSMQAESLAVKFIAYSDDDMVLRYDGVNERACRNDLSSFSNVHCTSEISVCITRYQVYRLCP
jgi:hypothetical protein